MAKANNFIRRKLAGPKFRLSTPRRPKIDVAKVPQRRRATRHAGAKSAGKKVLLLITTKVGHSPRCSIKHTAKDSAWPQRKPGDTATGELPSLPTPNVTSAQPYCQQNGEAGKRHQRVVFVSSTPASKIRHCSRRSRGQLTSANHQIILFSRAMATNSCSAAGETPAALSRPKWDSPRAVRARQWPAREQQYSAVFSKQARRRAVNIINTPPRAQPAGFSLL
jgi:hypothetical protein